MSSSSGADNRPSVQQVRAAARAIGSCLAGRKYAIVGGAACAVLGSTRETRDVDFVVPQGNTRQTKMLLKNDPHDDFHVAKGTFYTTYKTTPPVDIEILTPPALFQESFDYSTPTITVEGVEILAPSMLLNAKCRSILDRPHGQKKRTDAIDIQFLLNWIAANHIRPTMQEVPNASKHFVLWFKKHFKELDDWEVAGYNIGTGECSKNVGCLVC